MSVVLLRVLNGSCLYLDIHMGLFLFLFFLDLRNFLVFLCFVCLKFVFWRLFVHSVEFSFLVVI